VPVVIGCAVGIAPEVPHDPDVKQLFGFSDDVAAGSNDLQRSSTVGNRLIEVTQFAHRRGVDHVGVRHELRIGGARG